MTGGAAFSFLVAFTQALWGTGHWVGLVRGQILQHVEIP